MIVNIMSLLDLDLLHVSGSSTRQPLSRRTPDPNTDPFLEEDAIFIVGVVKLA